MRNELKKWTKRQTDKTMYNFQLWTPVLANLEFNSCMNSVLCSCMSLNGEYFSNGPGIDRFSIDRVFVIYFDWNYVSSVLIWMFIVAVISHCLQVALGLQDKQAQPDHQEQEVGYISLNFCRQNFLTINWCHSLVGFNTLRLFARPRRTADSCVFRLVRVCVVSITCIGVCLDFILCA